MVAESLAHPTNRQRNPPEPESASFASHHGLPDLSNAMAVSWTTNSTTFYRPIGHISCSPYSLNFGHADWKDQKLGKPSVMLWLLCVKVSGMAADAKPVILSTSRCPDFLLLLLSRGVRPRKTRRCLVLYLGLDPFLQFSFDVCHVFDIISTFHTRNPLLDFSVALHVWVLWHHLETRARLATSTCLLCRLPRLTSCRQVPKSLKGNT
jgi:hypothetical protein